MINWKYFTVGHANHLLYNPLNPTKLDEVIELAALPQGARVLDIACGNAEFLCRLAERYNASGVGIDLSPDFVPLARQRVTDRGLNGRLEIIEGDGADYQAPAESVDMASCLGGQLDLERLYRHASSLGSLDQTRRDHLVGGAFPYR